MSNVVYDHFGNEYQDLEDMCFSYGVLTSTFCIRRGNGMNVEEALRVPDCSFVTVSEHKPVYISDDGSYVDHKGNSFDTCDDMCEYWNTTVYSFSRCMLDGAGVKESLESRFYCEKTYALTYDCNSYVVPVSILHDNTDTCEHSDTEECTDKCIETEVEDNRPESYIEVISNHKKIYHIGDEVFHSVFELQKRFRILESTINSRLKHKWNLYDAVTKPVNTTHMNFCCPAVDHLGNEYVSVGEMTMKYNISVASFYQRIDSGWSIEDALTIPVRRRLARV